MTIARDGDGDACACSSASARWLGLGIAGVVNVFEPEYVVIGGGLSRAADLFFETARGRGRSRRLPALWERATVTLARGGADAGVIGAGVLAAQEAARDTARLRVESIEGAE